MIRSFVLTFLFSFTLFFICDAMEGFSVSSDSARIYYRTFGKGKPLLVINGGPGMSSEGFTVLAEKLAEKHLVILYDQRGTGRSKLRITDTSSITMKLMLDDMESLRKTLGITSWSILGHSFGGMVASYYAVFYPHRIRRLILSASGGIDLGLLTYFRSSLSSKLEQSSIDSISHLDKMMSEGDTTYRTKLERGMLMAPAYVYDKKFVPVIAQRLTQGNSRVNALIWADLDRIRFNCSEELRSFDKPVLIIQGRQDIIRPETAEKAHAVLKKSRIVLMDHCGHYGWLDNPSVYFSEIFAFLE